MYYFVCFLCLIPYFVNATFILTLRSYYLYFFYKVMCNMKSKTIQQSVNVNFNVDGKLNNEKDNELEPPSVNNEDN